ncbi:MAG TPA: PDZ domain-containing protein [Ktedonobacterales bacterium]|jgi:tricorn protease
MTTQGYIRFPTISGDRIVFTAEDDLWSVSTAGGRAERLTAGVAEATHASFSPDGSLLAFSGRDEGPVEVYVMPSEGGDARRLTYHGSRAFVAGWTPDGAKILYASPAGQPFFSGALHEIAPTGSEPVTWPYGPLHSVAFGPDGTRVFGRNTADPARWKRYRGGTAGYLWIAPAGSEEFHRLLNLDSNIASPCWVGARIYFISDHEGVGNVYSCLPSGKDIRRHTQHDDFYARGLSTDGKRLVYHAGGDLYLLDLDATGSQRLDVILPSARAHRARKFVQPAHNLDSWSPHPQGHSIALTVRGKPVTLGAWEGAVVQHGDADAKRYRLVTWLADGKRLAAVADDGDEPRLAVLTADGSAPERIFDGVDIGHVLEMRASPVDAQILLVNHRKEIMLVDCESGGARVLDRSDYGRGELATMMRGLAWAPDGRWVAYSYFVNAQQSIIRLCELASGKTYDASEPMLFDLYPAFDPAGRYLYFIGAREFDPVVSVTQFEYSFPYGQRPYLITLRRDLRSPFAPLPTDDKAADQEDEQAKERGKDAAANGSVNGGAKSEPVTPIAIDVEGITSRIVAFPVGDGRYGRVLGVKDGVVFTSFPVEGTRKKNWVPTTTPEANGALESYSFDSHKSDRLMDGVSDFEVTADGQTILVRAGDRLRLLKAGQKPEGGDAPGRETGWANLDRVKVSIRPEAEWRQMYAEAWRLQREQFWVADMGGVDWRAIRDRYAPLVERVGSRAELSDLFWEMQGELGSSHAYELGGDYRARPNYQQGHLGVDWSFDSGTGRYTIERILHGDPWEADATSPLLSLGANLQVGDVITAINGQSVTPERGPRQLLVNQAGAEVLLTVQPADGGAERHVTVRALGDEMAARYRDWVTANRSAVHDATNGRAGYIHIPDMGSAGYGEFHRAFLAEYERDALIVDVRHNGGGIVSGLLLEKLMRPRIGYSFQRWGPPEPFFIQSPSGRLVALTDEYAGSDGDIFSHSWKMLKLGPLIGKRTWGGVVGIEPYIGLADGTFTTQPEFAFWFNDVGWGVENYGVDPTEEVDYPPQDFAAGRDPQLERGIAEALRLIAEQPPAKPAPGPRPSRAAPALNGSAANGHQRKAETRKRQAAPR